MLCPSVTCAVHSANRTHCAGHVEFHTPARVENPSSPNPATQPGFCPSAGSANIHRWRSWTGFHSRSRARGVSCVARPGPHARCCANPARSPLQLQPLLGLCPFVAVVVSIRPTHTCVSRRSYSIPFTPGDTAACSHMPTVISLTYSDLTHAVPLTHSCRFSHTHHTTHPLCLIHTGGFAHACRFLRTRGLFHTRCPLYTRRAGKHASWHTRDHTTHTRGLFHTRGLIHTRGLFYTRGRSHTPLHSRYACVAARILTRLCTHTSTPQS